MRRKAMLKCLLDEYEQTIFNLSGKRKSEYVGQIGEVFRKSKRVNGTTGKCYLYDIRFSDGQVWCCEEEQLEFI